MPRRLWNPSGARAHSQQTIRILARNGVRDVGRAVQVRKIGEDGTEIQFTVQLQQLLRADDVRVIHDNMGALRMRQRDDHIILAVNRVQLLQRNEREVGRLRNGNRIRRSAAIGAFDGDVENGLRVEQGNGDAMDGVDQLEIQGGRCVGGGWRQRKIVIALDRQGRLEGNAPFGRRITDHPIAVQKRVIQCHQQVRRDVRTDGVGEVVERERAGEGFRPGKDIRSTSIRARIDRELGSVILIGIQSHQRLQRGGVRQIVIADGEFEKRRKEKVLRQCIRLKDRIHRIGLAVLVQDRRRLEVAIEQPVGQLEVVGFRGGACVRVKNPRRSSDGLSSAAVGVARNHVSSVVGDLEIEDGSGHLRARGGRDAQHQRYD